MSNINDYGLPFTSQDGDRKYSALEWREYFSRLIHNGLIQNAANECQVKPQAVPNKTVYVDTGVVFVNGAMRILEEPVTLAVAENTSGNPRIDRVVARLNEASRTVEFAVLEGTPAVSPVAPDLTRTEGVYELGLADITLANGYSTITAAEITDQRWDVSLCGASSMTIGVIPPSGLEAETVTLSPETQALYGVENVDDAINSFYPVHEIYGHKFIPSDDLLAEDLSLFIGSLSTSYHTAKSFYSKRGGKFKFTGELLITDNTRTASVAIFDRYGNQISTSFSTSSTTFVPYELTTTTQIKPFEPIYVRVKSSSTSSGQPRTQNVRVYGSLIAEDDFSREGVFA